MKSLLLFGAYIFITSCATQENQRINAVPVASQVGFEATLDKNSVEVGEDFTLDLKWTLSVNMEGRLAEPKLPDLKDFELLGESSHSESDSSGEYLRYINTRHYNISPRKIGNLVIGPAEIRIGNEVLKTKPLTVLVSPSRYEEALKINKCDKQYWSRYLIGSQYQSLSKKYALSPYDIMFGSEYMLRKVNPIDRLWAAHNFVNYSDLWPEVIQKKYDQRFGREDRVNQSDDYIFIDYEDKEKKTQNQKAVFNISVKRDFECYRKLK